MKCIYIYIHIYIYIYIHFVELQISSIEYNQLIGKVKTRKAMDAIWNASNHSLPSPKVLGKDKGRIIKAESKANDINND